MEPPPHQEASDADLVDRANRGDAAAFEALFDRHRDWAFALALRHVGHHETALDVRQDAFLWLLRQFPGFELRAPLRGVLFPVIQRRARDLRAKAARRRTGSLVADVEAPDPPSSATELAEALEEILADLSEDARETLLLRYVEGLSVAETAAATGVPEGTVKSRLHHALTALRTDPRTRNLFNE